MPKVTIFMPSYNHEKFVAQAIQSVLDQTYEDFEFLIGDDGSKDKTPEIIASFKDPRIKFFPGKTNRGACVVGMDLIERSTGEYITYIPSDDFWPKDRLEIQVSYLDQHPECGAVFGQVVVVGADGLPPPLLEGYRQECIFRQKDRSRGQWLRLCFTAGNRLAATTHIIRRTCMDDIGPFDNRFRQIPDFYQWSKLLKKYDIHVSEKPLVYARMRPGENASSPIYRNRVRGMNEYHMMAKTFFDDVPNDVLIDGFSDLMIFKTPPSPEHFDIEKAFLYINTPKYGALHKSVGLEKLFHLLASPSHRKILQEDYHFGDLDYQNLSAKIETFSSFHYAIPPRLRRTVSYLDAKSYCARFGDPYTEILPSRTMPAPSLNFFNPPPFLEIERGSLNAAPAYFAIVKNTQAFSGCRSILANDVLINDALLHPRAQDVPLTDEQDKKPLVLSFRNDKALIQLSDKEPLIFEKGLMMFGNPDCPYRPWVLEYLPRVLAFNHPSCPDDFPFIVEENLAKPCLDLLRFLDTRRRKIIAVPEHASLRFNELGVAPVPAFASQETMWGALYDTVWPKDIFEEIHKRLSSAFPKAATSKKQKLFIARQDFRSYKIVNDAEIASFLEAQGFRTIVPHTMTFQQQAEAFQSASLVVGGCTSALLNCLFCEEGTPVLALTNDSPSFNFNEYASILEAAGCRPFFLRGTGKPMTGEESYYTLDFSVSLKDLEEALNKLQTL